MFRIPKRADVCFGFATSPDFVAYTGITGVLQNILRKCKVHMHLVDMHTMINEKAAVEVHDTDEGFYKKMPEIQHTLCKNVYYFLRTTVELCCTLMIYCSLFLSKVSNQFNLAAVITFIVMYYFTCCFVLYPIFICVVQLIFLHRYLQCFDNFF